ncbi:unnamed protein product [Cylindrotheca closterium]|uniref:Uncharacterized protein n=1 Tax=Cylindrotheca closterium TaxID=2856 RepID=A0AAD2G499_9STRA|nr:unnamed protein product [Cylindrotheca closterium]
MSFQGQRIPSLIFCADSSSSLTSMISYPSMMVDAEDVLCRPSSGFGQRFGLDYTSTKSKAPSLPRRQSSRGMGFRKISCSSGTGGHGESKMNARFQIDDSTMKNKSALFDKFCSIAPMLSPSLSEGSRKTIRSAGSTDTPLSIPLRKPSQQSLK